MKKKKKQSKLTWAGPQPEPCIFLLTDTHITIMHVGMSLIHDLIHVFHQHFLIWNSKLNFTRNPSNLAALIEIMTLSCRHIGSWWQMRGLVVNDDASLVFFVLNLWCKLFIWVIDFKWSCKTCPFIYLYMLFSLCTCTRRYRAAKSKNSKSMQWLNHTYVLHYYSYTHAYYISNWQNKDMQLAW